ncbi:MAG: hypothetical protein WBX25_16680 [Rhodomicrobium sp.]
MTDEELIAQIKNLSALAPTPDKFMRSSSTSKGSGRRMQTTQSQTLDKDAFQQAQTDFANSPAGKQLAALQTELGDRRKYSNSPLGSIAGPLSYAGEIPGSILATVTTPKGTVAPAGTTPTGRAFALTPYAARAIPAGIAAVFAQRDALDPSNPPWRRDTSQGVATGMMGYASYPAVRGLLNAFSTVGQKDLKDVPPEEGPPPRGPAITGQPKEALKDMAKHLGVPIDPKAPKEEVAKAVQGAFNNADEATARTLAARFNEIGQDAAHSLPEAAVRKNVGNIIGRLAKDRATLTGIAGLGALLGASSTSDEAQAGPSVTDEEPSAIDRAMAIARGVADVAPYTRGPMALQSMMEATPEVPPGPETATTEGRAKAIYQRAQADRNLRDAQAEDARQLREMRARKSLTSTDYRGIPGEAGTTPPPALSKVFPHSAKFAPASDENARQLLEDARTVQDQPEQHLAKGGAVDGPVGGQLSRPTHIRMSKTLQHLEAEMHKCTAKMDKLQAAVHRTGNQAAKAMLDKVRAERQEVIDRLWDTHDWAKAIRYGRAPDLEGGMTRTRIIEGARARKMA